MRDFLSRRKALELVDEVIEYVEQNVSYPSFQPPAFGSG
jgi:hypothetical protein